MGGEGRGGYSDGMFEGWRIGRVVSVGEYWEEMVKNP